MELLERISAERGMTLIVVTHDAGVAARANRVVRMLDGRILAEEPRRADEAVPREETATGGC